jgi:NitT/TauT family transport system substrate-binding protein
VIEFGQAVSTAIGLVPSVKQNGLGFTDPEPVAMTASRVNL